MHTSRIKEKKEMFQQYFFTKKIRNYLPTISKHDTMLKIPALPYDLYNDRGQGQQTSLGKCCYDDDMF